MSNVVSFIPDLPHIPGEIKLWRAVLATVLKDACMKPKDGMNGRTLQAIRQANSWIGTQDFREVCLLADVDPDCVLTGLANGGLKRLLGISFGGRPGED